YVKKPFLVNEYGKPYLPTNFNLQFNVSHSGEWVVCAVDERPVGIDVELMRKTDMLEIAHRFFAAKEYDMLSNADKSIRKELFYDIWTLKESYIKALGKGLSIKLNSFSIILAGNTISYETQIQHEQCYFKQYYIDASYRLSVCSFSHSFPPDIIYLDINDVCNSLITHV
ncbi:MAG: phosphopantetheine--protein transferase, partial [Clostridia bacterium]|nr:phosphopantetheine--protein transferase [Clostridia bacterium]